jgi:hypothetical protein
MQLSAVLSRDELAHVIGELAPLDVELSRRPRRVLSIGRPSLVELVPGAGLRVSGDARLTWDVAGVSVPVTIRTWRVMLVPRIDVRDDGHVLAFDPKIESLDVSNVPGFVAAGVIGSLEAAMAGKRDGLAWAFGRRLGVRKMLSERVSPPSRLDLVPAGGEVEVTASSVRLTIELEAHVRRGALGLEAGARRSA